MTPILASARSAPHHVRLCDRVEVGPLAVLPLTLGLLDRDRVVLAHGGDGEALLGRVREANRNHGARGAARRDPAPLAVASEAFHRAAEGAGVGADARAGRRADRA